MVSEPVHLQTHTYVVCSGKREGKGPHSAAHKLLSFLQNPLFRELVLEKTNKIVKCGAAVAERGAWEISVLPTSFIPYLLSLTDPEQAILCLVEWA